MPLALLLQDIGKTLKLGISRVSIWNQLVELESLLVARARSAFLVHWFGYGVPVSGLNLSGYIVNIDELEARFLRAKNSVATSPRGPNLTEPLMGLGGTIAGMLLSPVGAIAGASVLLRYAQFSISVLLMALAWLLIPAGVIAEPRLGLLLGIVVPGLLAGGALAAGSADRRDDRALYNLLGDLPRFMSAFTSLLNQLAGPRSAVQNPLTRRLLEVADALAGGLPQVLGFVAVLVRRVGPVLVPLARVFAALRALFSVTMSVLGEIWDGLMTGIDSLVDGPLSPVRAYRRVVDAIMSGIGRLLSRDGFVVPLFDALWNMVIASFGAFPSQVAAWRSSLYWLLFDLVREAPVVVTIDALKTQIDTFVAALEATPAPEHPEPTPTAFERAIPPFPVPVLPSFPDFPELPALPDTELLRRWSGVENAAPLTLDSILIEAHRAAAAPGALTFELGPDAARALEAARRPRSIFGRELRALRDDAGRTPAEQFALSAEELGRFRDSFDVIVGRVLPPEMRATYMPILEQRFAQIESLIQGREVAPREDLPVLDFHDNDRLRPVVHQLRFRIHGASHGEVRAFQDLLVEQLNDRRYHAPGEP